MPRGSLTARGTGGQPVRRATQTETVSFAGSNPPPAAADIPGQITSRSTTGGAARTATRSSAHIWVKLRP